MVDTSKLIDNLLHDSRWIPELSEWKKSLDGSRKSLENLGEISLEVAQDNSIRCLHQSIRQRMRADKTLAVKYAQAMRKLLKESYGYSTSDEEEESKEGADINRPVLALVD